MFKQKVVQTFEVKLTEDEKRELVQQVLRSNLNNSVYEQLLKAENCVVCTTAPFAFVSRMDFGKEVRLISSLDSSRKWPDAANFGPGKVENLKFLFSYEDIVVKNFYTDSSDDRSLVELSQNAYMVGKDGIVKIK